MRFAAALASVASLVTITLAFTPRIQDGGTEAHRATVTKAIAHANGHINAMVTKLDGSSGKTLIQNAFGPNVDSAKVKTCAKLLKDGKVFFDSVDPDPNLGTAAAATRSNGHVIFGDMFFVGTSPSQDEFRAGTVVHEASHALCETYDWFDKTTCAPVQRTQNAYNGYADSPDFNTLKAKCGQSMHQNADSYRLMAMASTSLAPVGDTDWTSSDQIVFGSDVA